MHSINSSLTPQKRATPEALSHKSRCSAWDRAGCLLKNNDNHLGSPWQFLGQERSIQSSQHPKLVHAGQPSGTNRSSFPRQVDFCDVNGVQSVVGLRKRDPTIGHLLLSLFFSHHLFISPVYTVNPLDLCAAPRFFYFRPGIPSSTHPTSKSFLQPGGPTSSSSIRAFSDK